MQGSTYFTRRSPQAARQGQGRGGGPHRPAVVGLPHGRRDPVAPFDVEIARGDGRYARLLKTLSRGQNIEIWFQEPKIWL